MIFGFAGIFLFSLWYTLFITVVEPMKNVVQAQTCVSSKIFVKNIKIGFIISSSKEQFKRLHIITLL